tara:strand:+ start:521 stop:1231 length:711 start_codon:yes stop_codon:yes gene_type:complete
MQTVVNEINKKLKIQFEINGWDKILNPFINSKHYKNISDKLINSVEENKRFTPKYKNIFNAFTETNLNNLKVVIVGQDPYPGHMVADGLAFSCSGLYVAENYLKLMLKETIGDWTVTGRVYYTKEECDLKRWAHQGVLLLNTALTCEINKLGSHQSLWKPFTEHVFTEINKFNKDIIFVLMGRKAESWQLLLPGQKILKCVHPAAAQYKGGKWMSDKIFDRINQELKSQKKTCIKW